MGLHLLIDDPTRWAALSLWVPITDLARWHGEDEAADDGRYWRDVEACCGGPPGPDTEEEYRYRSPLGRLSSPSVAGVAIDLNAGVRDGHAGAVPIGHTLRAFDALAEANGVAGRYRKGPLTSAKRRAPPHPPNSRPPCSPHRPLLAESALVKRRPGSSRRLAQGSTTAA